MAFPSRSRGARLGVAALALALALGACSKPPARAGRDPGQNELPAPPSDTAEKESRPGASPYDLEAEGVFPPPSRDVEFEEDRLPAPESVDASGWGGEKEPIGDENLDPPAVDPIEPSVAVPVEPTRDTPDPGSTAPETMRGWRVQLAASGERPDAERLAREARTRLRVPVYVDFESPLFKVRAGDFVDRADALRLRDRARANGYDGAWVVTTEIAGGP